MMRNGDTGYVMTGRGGKRFFRQRIFKRDDIVKHRREPPRRLDRPDSGKSKSE
jgi:hypothetical protein